MDCRSSLGLVICGLFLYFLVQVHCQSGENFSDKVIKDSGLLVLTVATDATDGFKRFMRSANKYKYNVQVVGMGEQWQGGDVAQFAGGGHKVNMLKKVMQDHKDKDDLVIMFVDSYDVVFTRAPAEVMKVFKRSAANVLFSAEGFCWPDPQLASKYPEVKLNEKRFLNSGGFMGYAKHIYEIITHEDIHNEDDDQLYYTKIYLEEGLRNKFKMKLDTRSEVFQNLNGALEDVQVKFKGSSSFLYNFRTGNTPMVVHGNGPIKTEFNRLTDYLADKWTPTSGCMFCGEDKISLKGVKDEDFPRVMVAAFLDRPTPFGSDFLDKIAALNYPKAKMDLFIFHNDNFHKKDVDSFVSKYLEKYRTIKIFTAADNLNQWSARNKALERCLTVNCQYLFVLHGEAQIEKSDTLRLLIEQNRTVVGPMIQRKGKLWSNFWGTLGKDGFYKRSDDYMEIVQSQKRGLWNIPYLTDAYLIHGNIVEQLLGGYISGDLDPDMAICKTMRDKGIFMFVSNQEYVGHLVKSENFDSTVTNPDFYQIFDNRYDWEKKYIHENYSKQLDQHFEVEQICTDVYWIPFVTDTFAKHLIEIMEAFGQWSGGKNEDKRLTGGYENVPTDDIHMNQVGLERQWLQMLKDYVAPIATKVYPGYYSDSRAIMNFVVKYHPDRQKFLRPHHDSSTFTINIALNKAGVDYQGGGTRFIRYNCDLLDSRVGWMLMHPGRLTHYHEGLPITNGTRYIMVSFIDP